MKTFKYLIVGGGMAADAAVKGIRAVDGTGEIGIVTAEPQGPYARPPLSKDLWKDGELDAIWCETEARGAAIVTGRQVVSVDPGRKRVLDERGDAYAYEKLLLATGGNPRRLAVSDPHIVYYRTLDDYRHVRKLCDEFDRFVVAGGNFIGAEMAAALTLQERSVSMVFPEAGIGGTVFPDDLAAFLNGYYRDKGVDVQPGASVANMACENDHCRVELESGQAIEAGAVVAGLGVEPADSLAKDAGLETGDGILVDEMLRTSHPDVFAAGDVALFHCPALDRRLRVEHEDNALTMGEAAGRNMAGANDVYHHIPFFYSDLFDLGYEAVGQLDASLETVSFWEKRFERGIVFYLDQRRVRGVLFWNVWDKVPAGRELIEAGGPVEKKDLDAWYRERLSEE